MADFDLLEDQPAGLAGGAGADEYDDAGAIDAELPEPPDAPRRAGPAWRDPWFIAGGLFTVGVVVYLTSRPARPCADCAQRAKLEESAARTAGYDAEREARVAAAAAANGNPGVAINPELIPPTYGSGGGLLDTLKASAAGAAEAYSAGLLISDDEHPPGGAIDPETLIPAETLEQP